MNMARRTMWIFLLASVVLTGGSGEASQLLYVTSADSYVYTYDVSLGSAAAIKASENALIGNFYNSDPASVALNSAGTIYVGNQEIGGTGNSKVTIYSSNGTYQTQWTTPGNVGGLAIDASGNVFLSIYNAVTGSSSIEKRNASGAVLQTITGASLTKATGLARTAAGTLYASNFIPAFADDAVATFDAAGNELPSFGNGALAAPVAVDSANNVYVGYMVEDVVRKYTSSGTLLADISTTGPRGIAIDGFGNMYVANGAPSGSVDHTISKFDSSGNLLFSWDFAGTSQPNGMAFAPVAVPEPSTYVMALAGVACGGYLRFRRRKQA